MGGRFGVFAVAAFAGSAIIDAAEAAIVGAPQSGQIGFLPANSIVQTDIEWFHNTILLPVTIGISLLVLALLAYVVLRFNENANPTPSRTSHNGPLEIAWTVAPALILVVIVMVVVAASSAHSHNHCRRSTGAYLFQYDVNNLAVTVVVDFAEYVRLGVHLQEGARDTAGQLPAVPDEPDASDDDETEPTPVAARGGMQLGTTYRFLHLAYQMNGVLENVGRVVALEQRHELKVVVVGVLGAD